MSQQQHTALPWRVGPTISPVEGPRYATITDGNSRVADVYADFSSIPKMEANAAFIVQAVNAHADLVEALRHAEALISRTALAGGLDQETYDAHKVLARAALAKAGDSKA